MCQYVEWGGSNKHQDFFTSGTIRAMYKNNIAYLAKRVNPLTGIKYADDPVRSAPVLCAFLRGVATHSQLLLRNAIRYEPWVLCGHGHCGVVLICRQSWRGTWRMRRDAKAAETSQCRTGAGKCRAVGLQLHT